MLIVWSPLTVELTEKDKAWAKRLAEKVDANLPDSRCGVGGITTHIDEVGIAVFGHNDQYILETISPILKLHCPQGAHVYVEDLTGKRPRTRFPLFSEHEQASNVPV